MVVKQQQRAQTEIEAAASAGDGGAVGRAERAKLLLQTDDDRAVSEMEDGGSD